MLNAAAVTRAVRGTRWKLARFKHMRTKVVAHVHDAANGYSMAFTLRHGGNAADFLQEIRRATKKSHEQVLADEQEQSRLLSGQPVTE